MLKRLSNQTKGGLEHLEELKDKNNRLYEMYLLKEDLLSMYENCSTGKEAFEHILSWADTVKKAKYAKLEKFVKTLATHIMGVLNWFKHKISNGKAEGINNKIKSIMRNAYGYKNMHYFRLKILQKCGYLMYAHPHFLN